MPRLLIDMDGVLCDLQGKWFARYNEDYGDDLDPKRMQRWGPHHYARAGRAIYKYLRMPGFFRDLAPIPGAVEGMRQLTNRGYDCVIVTAARNGHRDKLDWVAEHLPFIPYRHVVFAHRKELVRGDLLFDDSPEQLQAFAPFGISVAMAHPYNEHSGAHRVPDWPAFVELVKRLFDPPTS